MNSDSTPSTDQADVAEENNPTSPTEDESSSDEALILDDLLVEEVSIDGMCGVY